MPGVPEVSVYQYPSENQNDDSEEGGHMEVSVYQYPSENQNETETFTLNNDVSVYQYPSENQNKIVCRADANSVSVYQYPSENQNNQAGDYTGIEYQFINIHQRTKTGNCPLCRHPEYQFINIHQRTKTARYSGSCGFGSIVSTKLYLKKIFGVKEMFVLHLFAAQQLHLGVLLFGN